MCCRARFSKCNTLALSQDLSSRNRSDLFSVWSIIVLQIYTAANGLNDCWYAAGMLSLWLLLRVNRQAILVCLEHLPSNIHGTPMQNTYINAPSFQPTHPRNSISHVPERFVVAMLSWRPAMPACLLPPACLLTGAGQGWASNVPQQSRANAIAVAVQGLQTSHIHECFRNAIRLNLGDREPHSTNSHQQLVGGTGLSSQIPDKSTGT